MPEIMGSWVAAALLITALGALTGEATAFELGNFDAQPIPGEGDPSFVQAVSGGECRLDAPCASLAGTGCEQAWLDANLRLNQIQTLGTHNSYKQFISPPEFEILSERDETAFTREYGHEPITEQLKAGMRSFEIDVAYDPEGGLYLNPLLHRLATEKGMRPPPLEHQKELASPGFKVMHDPDIDYRVSCPTFKACLMELKVWSDQNRNHVPVLILVNPKVRPYDGLIDDPDGVKPLPFDASTFEALEKELLEVIPLDRLITPDEVRGHYATLREAAKAGNWPLLGKSRGRFIVIILDRPPFSEPYYKGRTSLQGRAMFVYAPEGHPASVYYTIDDPIEEAELINALTSNGFLVRTRTEQDTIEVRSGDTTKRSAAFKSSAQFISTDYYLPNPNFSDYRVTLPGDSPARCNPVLAAALCGDVLIEE